MGDRKFKAGDKVKFPKTKSAYDNYLSFLKEVQRICTVHPAYLVVVKEYGTDSYILDIPVEFSMNELSNKVFHKNDLELYVDTKSGMVGSEYDDIEKFKPQSGIDKVIVVNPSKVDFTEEFNRLTEPNKVIDSSLHSALWNIKVRDIEFFNEIEKLIHYLSSTYSDKYENTDNYSKRKLLSKEGKAANIFTALKYIQRYDTVGYSKSENPQDLLKSCHYLLFENQRKTKHG